MNRVLFTSLTWCGDDVCILYVSKLEQTQERQNRLAHNCQWQLQDIINAISGADRSITFVGFR